MDKAAEVLDLDTEDGSVEMHGIETVEDICGAGSGEQ
jgi:hypothetical protein